MDRKPREKNKIETYAVVEIGEVVVFGKGNWGAVVVSGLHPSRGRRKETAPAVTEGVVKL